MTAATTITRISSRSTRIIADGASWHSADYSGNVTLHIGSVDDTATFEIEMDAATIRALAKMIGTREQQRVEHETEHVTDQRAYSDQRGVSVNCHLCRTARHAAEYASKRAAERDAELASAPPLPLPVRGGAVGQRQIWSRSLRRMTTI